MGRAFEESPAPTPHALGRWEHFPHGADVGIRGIGPTLGSAFAQATRALTAVVVDPDTVASALTVEIRCSGTDPEDLLYTWLNAVIYEMATRQMLFGAIDVSLDGNRLAATLRGEHVSPERHAPAVEIKGATYTALSVRHDENGWVAECILDV